MSIDYLLHESPIGYAVFKVILQPDTIGSRLQEVQKAVQDLDKFGKTVELVGLAPFQGTQDALQEINDISEGILSDFLRATLETNLPKAGKKKTITLGVSEKNLAGSIKAAFPNLSCETSDTSEVTGDLLRGLRQHSGKLIKKLQPGDIDRSILGLGHAYSRAKVKFSVQKQDNHIIQAIATLDQIDKDLNQFCMRLRENYGWHFPELSKIVSNNEQYAKVVLAIGNKSRLTEDDLHDLAAVVDDDEGVAQAIVKAARTSMGRDLSEADMEIVMAFAKRTASLAAYRKQLSNYLGSRMGQVAPNLAALIGDTVGARLISKAGSLTNLSKYPASTVQILGAEKALFRALKTKGNTPKYGLIYHSSFIGKTGAKSKGRISRFLANKCSIASRIDNFSDTPTSKFGEALKRQVEERIEFYASGAPPAKNSAVMQAAMNSVLADIGVEDPTATATEDVEMADGVTAAATEQAARKEKKEKKDKKKDKKSKHADEEEVSEKKSKKDKKRKHGDDDGESKKKKKSKA
ncbi:Nop domain-containing protein [Dothidotthia symphoricarpi CBS 119687]|uniref:Nucleolar protein 56 n=1 Tax=Dothidotthia symphoricarpi CBS 119687 TaxID=1392245 RepID=A0A6A6AFH8_9PLEO|nr:Nop domain-containing protein [Dothidotthia symphoricarpi CBS 119687]KAF2130053.1 Nop domain-containing protein [Dothidotthia symphoricarpi CBS 119687]